MAGPNIEIRQERRCATLRLSDYWQTRYNLTETEVPCVVHGVYQCADEDSSGPMFVCELQDGRCLYGQIDEVTFLKGE